MGAGVPRGARPPSRVAYYVALAGILGLLLLLCFYFLYYFVTKVKELSRQENLTQTPAPPRTPPVPVAVAYPVQPVVRDSATAMARLCKQLPPPPRAAVHPATSPAALHTDTGGDSQPGGGQVTLDKLPIAPVPHIGVMESAR